MTTHNAIFSFAWLVCLLIAALLQATGGWWDIQSFSIYLVLSTLILLAFNWQSTSGGRNPSFLFLCFGLVFMLGRAVPSILGGTSQLQHVQFGSEFTVASDVVITYGLLTLASFLFVHIGSSIVRNEYPVKERMDTQVDGRIYLSIFLMFLPFYLYKNYYYFDYIRQSGGYLAIYLDAEHLNGIGVLPRISSLICLSAFSLYFFYETDKKAALRWLIFFSVIFSSELLVGLRGKFFVTIITFIQFYKFRFGGKFTARGMGTIAISVVALAILVEITREQKDDSTIEGNPLLGFLVQQGVTAGVNLTVMENYSYFEPHALSYFWHQIFVPFYSQTEVASGWFLANDVSQLVQPKAYALGFGTGSSYLAELFLLGGVIAVIFGSFVIGRLLTALKRNPQGIVGALSFWIVCGLIYYPRTMLHDPLHNLMRYGPPILLLSILCRVAKKIPKLTRQ